MYGEINILTREHLLVTRALQNFSRIDYFLVLADFIPKMSKCWSDSILISDHAPTSLLIKFSNVVPTPSRWRLESIWLRDPSFIEYIGRQIDLYFENNTNQKTASVRLEALKAFLRGQIINVTSFKYKSQIRNGET